MSESWYETPGDAIYPEAPSDGPALDGWDNLPPHLREALRGAMEGLSGAIVDLSSPLDPALRAVWDVTDQIEEWLLARERDSEFRE